MFTKVVCYLCQFKNESASKIQLKVSLNRFELDFISLALRITLFSKICIRNKTRKRPNKYQGMKTAMTLVRSFTINNKKTPWGIWGSFLRNQYNI